MNVWLIVHGALFVALLATVLGRASLHARYPVVLTALTALLVATCLAQWLTEGAGAWTLALGAIAVVVSVFAVFKAQRGARAPTIP
jgi:hypothetical protein